MKKSEDNPIQNVNEGGIFSKLKSFENDLGYNFQKEMEAFERYLDEEEKKENEKSLAEKEMNESNTTNNTNYSKNKSYSNDLKQDEVEKWLSRFIICSVVWIVACVIMVLINLI